MDNLLLATDSYKLSHFRQYPKDTKIVSSYFESRGSTIGCEETVFFGLQYIIKKWLAGKVVTKEKIDEAEDVCNFHLGKGQFNRSGWEYILHAHNGYLPIRIRAVAEGTVVPNHNVLMTVENTDPACFWLTNYLETLLVQTWYPTTVASMGRMNRLALKSALEQSGDPSTLDFKLHDFGVRGVTCMEQAGIGGAAHLIHFKGTDNLPALMFLRKYYNENCGGFSIPASEHSTITSWGRENEAEAMRNMLEQYPDGLVACVSDSFDIFKACSDIWGGVLKDKIMARNGCLVIRPDSGEAIDVLPKCLEILWDKFGGFTNRRGYKILDRHVRLIQGDGVSLQTMKRINEVLMSKGWSIDNLAYGSGGALLQKMDRDTFKFAFKCSAILRGNTWQDVYKQPVNEPFKKSKSGRLRLIKRNEKFETIRDDSVEALAFTNHLDLKLMNGLEYNETSLSEIKKLALN
jgi:nicotinamide phosphoribosyltransferase